MKKLIVLLILFFTVPCFAQQVIPTNQITIAWDESTSVGVLPGTFSYEVFTIPEGLDKTVEANWVSVGEVSALIETVTFTVEGKHIVGVRTKRILADGTTNLFSDVNWSDENGVNTPDPFVVFYAINPSEPPNLRHQ
jgi:hypothetical protein